jgi:hypothetical protein
MNCLLLSFLIINALFWGLFPHSAHCQLVDQFSKLVNMKVECPEHKIHLLMGLVFYVASVYVAQKDKLN